MRPVWTISDGGEELFDYSAAGLHDVFVSLMELKAVIEVLRLVTRRDLPASPVRPVPT